MPQVASNRFICLVFILTSLGCFLSDSGQAVVSNQIKTWFKLPSPADQVTLSPKGQFIAYIDTQTNQLSMMEIDQGKVYRVLSQPSEGLSFFWANDGVRLIVRQLSKSNKSDIRSSLFIYDSYHKKINKIESLSFATGLPTYDPADSRVRLLYGKGIVSRKLHYPGQRLGHWQRSHFGGLGFFLAAQHGMLWVTKGGHKLERLQDDGSALTSFRISPDGVWVTWATSQGRIYVNKQGGQTTFVDHGRDPSWHPIKHQLIYSGARMIGRTAINYDIKLWEPGGRHIWLTDSQSLNERWPQWLHGNMQAIIFTRERTAEILTLELGHRR